MGEYRRTPSSLTGFVLERLGCPLHYWLGGPQDGPLIVLLHGATLDHRMFNAQVKALLPSYRVLVWDARGHGRSQPMGENFSMELCAEDLFAILDEIAAPQAVIGGQSMGGYIAQHFYALAPQRVGGMIVIGATPIGKAYRRREVYALKATLPLLERWPYRHLARTVARHAACDLAARRYALEAMQQISRRDFLRIWRAVTLTVDHRGRKDFSIDVPLLLLCGEHDGFGVIRREMALWAEAEKNATYHVVPDAGHNANQDRPAFTNEKILQFLKQHAGCHRPSFSSHPTDKFHL